MTTLTLGTKSTAYQPFISSAGFLGTTIDTTKAEWAVSPTSPNGSVYYYVTDLEGYAGLNSGTSGNIYMQISSSLSTTQYSVGTARGSANPQSGTTPTTIDGSAIDTVIKDGINFYFGYYTGGSGGIKATRTNGTTSGYTIANTTGSTTFANSSLYLKATYYVMPDSSFASTYFNSATKNSATISWDAVSNSSPSATNYEVSYRVSGGTWTVFTTTSSTSVTVTGLSPSTTYEFRMSAYIPGAYALSTAYKGPYSLTTSGTTSAAVTWSGSYSNAKVNTSYGDSIRAIGATTISRTAGSIPPGTSDYQSGEYWVVSGTPTATGTYSFTLDADGVTQNASIYVAPLVPPVWVDSTVSTSFVVGTAYSDAISATNATAYSVFSGALPSGITLDAGTGVLSGTPTTKQIFSFSLRASNSDGNLTTVTFAGTTSAPPVWIDSALAGIYQGRTYSDGVAATSPISGSPTQYTVSTGTLPTGLSLNSSTGEVTGTTYASGSYSFSISATNADGSITQAFSGTIILAPYWTDNTLSSFINNVEYFNGVVAANSPTYSVSTGALPTGISLNTGTGALTGTPTDAVGTSYSFTITATNGLGSISQVFSGQIQPDLGGKFRVYSGSAWVDGDVYVYDGSTWVLGKSYVYDGTNWIKTEY